MFEEVEDLPGDDPGLPFCTIRVSFKSREYFSRG
jgi:hypothetical protein